VVGAVVVVSVGAFGAEMGTVITKDGRTLEGEITRKGDEVHVDSGGRLTVLSKDQVKEIRPSVPVDAEYEKRLAGLAKDDVAGHVALAEWCLERGRPDLALQRCEHALKIAPKHTNAKLLRGAAQRRMKSKPDAGRPRKKRGRTPGGKRQGKLLTDKEIGRIRLAELKPGERVKVRFADGLLDRFLDAVAGTRPEYSTATFRRDFRDKSNSEKLADIVKATALYYADEIEVSSDPVAIRVFRKDIMPIVKVNCATSKCHGGAAKIRLYTQRKTEAVYTNFYTLDRFKKSVPGRGLVSMFDRGYPEEGLFLNYLLPRELVRDQVLAHPKVDSTDIKSAARSKESDAYIDTGDWLKEVLRRPRQDPGIEDAPAKKGAEKKGSKGSGDGKKPR